MASSMRMGMVLARSACNKVFSSLFVECSVQQRAVPQLSFTRGKRRSRRPPSLARPRTSKERFTISNELTEENQAFIKDLVVEKFPVRRSPLKEQPWERHEYTTRPRTLRTGVLAIKLGVIPQWSKAGERRLVSVLQVLDNHVIDYRPADQFASSQSCRSFWKNKYGICVVGALSCSPHLFTKEYNSLFLKAAVPPKRKLTRFLVTPNAAIQPGTPLYATHFNVGDYVDCQAKTIGHGFQGVVKRWRFKGGPASHGSTKFHRKPGSTGAGRKKKGRWKGKKMPGHMGMKFRTLRGLQIWRINTKYNLIYVKGGNIPGPNHCYVRIMDSTLRHRYYKRDQLPSMPTFYPDEQDEPLPEELHLEDVHNFSDPTLTFEEDGKAS